MKKLEALLGHLVIKHRWLLIAACLIFAASRRLADNVRLMLEGWGFFNTDSGDYYLYSIREDAFGLLQIFYYF